LPVRELFRFGCVMAKKKAIPLESPFLTPAEKPGWVGLGVSSALA
jgi:hypothetical protein